jgi:hypothetical protein
MSHPILSKLRIKITMRGSIVAVELHLLGQIGDLLKCRLAHVELKPFEVQQGLEVIVDHCLSVCLQLL